MCILVLRAQTEGRTGCCRRCTANRCSEFCAYMEGRNARGSGPPTWPRRNFVICDSPLSAGKSTPAAPSRTSPRGNLKRVEETMCVRRKCYSSTNRPQPRQVVINSSAVEHSYDTTANTRSTSYICGIDLNKQISPVPEAISSASPPPSCCPTHLTSSAAITSLLRSADG